MSPEQWEKLEQLYHRALERPAEERPRFLAEVCQDADLRAEVESLLRRQSGPEYTRTSASRQELVFGHDLKPGESLGPYEVVSGIGEGGMGKVYRALDTRLQRTVAIKVLASATRVDPSRRRRFMTEARMASALNHPNIVTLYDIGEHNGVDFLVLEYVPGKTLEELIPERGLPVDQVVAFGIQIANALTAAHSARIVHRDIKPSNVVITPESGVKVLDFGLAKSILPPAGESGLTAPGLVVGTVAYMSPEQTRGEPVDARSDIFSLGSVLYRMLTGRTPFKGPSVLATMHQIAAYEPPLPSAVQPALPPDFDEVVGRALRKDKADRYQSASEFADALRSVRERSAPGTSSPSLQQRKTLIVGREAESEKLRQWLDRAINGQGSVALVLGEPGMGKTTLVDSFLESLQGAAPRPLIGRGSCVEQFGIREPYLPFLDAVGRLLSGQDRDTVKGFLEKYAPTWCLQFPGLLSDSALDRVEKEAIGATKERMLREFGDALDRIGAAIPVLLVIEDLHWADSSSIDLLLHIGRRLSGRRVLALGTARPQADEGRNNPFENCKRELRIHGAYTEIVLGSLSEDHVSRYVAERLTPNDFPAQLGEVVYTKSRGLPLFIAGVFQILVQRGDILLKDGCWRLAKDVGQIQLDVPESVRGLIARKLDALEERDRRRLECASVLGEEFPTTVVAALLGGDELEMEDMLERIRRIHGLIDAGGEVEFPDGSVGTRYNFVHALYQNALYGEIAPSRKAALHRKAGETLAALYAEDNSRIAGTLAVHFERGRDYRAAADQCIAAGNNALTMYAAAQAIEYYTHALELIAKLPMAERFEREVTTRYKRSEAYVSARMLEDATGDCEALIALARSASREDWECRALNALGFINNHARQPERMFACATEALAIAARVGDRALQADAKALLANSRMVVGDVTEAHVLFDEAIDEARRLRYTPALLHGLMLGGVARFFQTEYAEAERLETEAASVAEESRDGFYLALSLFYLGLSRANRGNIGGAFQVLSEAFELAKRNGNPIAMSRIPNGIGWLWREVGDITRAVEFNQVCVETARKTKALEAEANALINLIYDFLAADNPSKALDAMTRVEPLLERERWNQWRSFGVRYHAARAEYCLALRVLDDAQQYGETLLTNARKHGVPKYIAVAHRLLGEIAEAEGRLADAEEHLIGSMDALKANPAPLTEWRVLAAFGRMLARAGRPAAARERFMEAARVIDAIASTITDPAMTSSFRIEPSVSRTLAQAAGTR